MTWIDGLCKSYGEKQWNWKKIMMWAMEQNRGVEKRGSKNVCKNALHSPVWSTLLLPSDLLAFYFCLKSVLEPDTWYLSSHSDFGSPSGLQLYLPFGLRLLLMHYSKGPVFSILHVNPYAQPLASRNLHSNYSWWLEGQERGGKESNSDFIFWKILLSFLVLKEHRFQK